MSGAASWPHRSSWKGFSELRISDSRFRAEIPGTWPAQICRMRTRRCAMVARKSSTCRGRTESRDEAPPRLQPCSPYSEPPHRLPQGSQGPRRGDSPAHCGPSWPCPSLSMAHLTKQLPTTSAYGVLQTPSRGTRDDGPCSKGNKGSATLLANLGKPSSHTVSATELGSEPGLVPANAQESEGADKDPHGDKRTA